MGPPRIPPQAQFIVMTDSSTGTRYLLTHDGVSAAVELSTTLPTGRDVVIYGPYEGPYLNGNVRLRIAGGVLFGEELALTADKEYRQRVLARLGNSNTYVEVTVPATWVDGDPLVFTQIVI